MAATESDSAGIQSLAIIKSGRGRHIAIIT